MSAAQTQIIDLTGHEPLRRVVARDEPREPSTLHDVEALMTRLAATPDLAGQMALEHLASGGKRLRARLALAAASAMGGARRDAVAWAAAVELLHNATLIHDDIQDGDRTRRGNPTLWTTHGRAQAINAGDLLLMLPYVAIAETSEHVRGPLSAMLAQHAVLTVRGQVAELDMLPSQRLDGGSYRRAITGKTGALFALPICGAAILSGRSRMQADDIGDAFMPIGVLFQLQDDVLDLYGNKGRGVVGSDLYEGKVSALVVAHLARRPGDRAWLLQLLDTPRDATDPAEVARAIAAFRASGALGDVLDAIDRIASGLSKHRALQREPALDKLADELCQRALAPIAHLISDRKEGAA